MKHKLKVCFVTTIHTILVVYASYAENRPIAIKQGGISYDSMWNVQDVRTYLSLPQIDPADFTSVRSMDEISKSVESVQSVGGYHTTKNNNDPFRLRSNEISVISFEFRSEEQPVFNVSVYDYRSWNRMCDMLFKYVTSTVELWNTIPDYYEKEQDDNAYTLTRKGGRVQRWHFSTRDRYVLAVDAVPSQVRVMGEENVIVEMDKLVRELVGLIEGSD